MTAFAESFLESIAATIQRHGMLKGGECVLVGLSGGPDSVALTSALSRLADKYRLTLHAAYMDHGLRPDEIPAEIDHCKALCKGLGIAFHTKSIDVGSETGENIHEAARRLRYDALEALAKEHDATRIALGHNRNDQAETVIMRLVRGAGQLGLSGIPPVRDRVIRPLIDTGRHEIERYLSGAGLGYVTDSSNATDKYLRNMLRSAVMPVLREINPSLDETLARTAAIFRDEEASFVIPVAKALMRMISSKTDDAIELYAVPLQHMEKPLARRVMRRAIELTRGLRSIGFTHVEDMLELARSGRAGRTLHLPGGVRVVMKYSTVLITCGLPEPIGEYELDADGEVLITESGARIRAELLDSCDGPLTEDSGPCVVLDAALVKFPLTIRQRADGDFFYPMGFGHRKKLQDFLTDRKMPKHERPQVPVVLSGDDIVWIAGLRADERFRRSENTGRYLRLTFTPPETA